MTMTFDTIASSLVGTRMLDDLVGDGFAATRPLTDLTEAVLYEFVIRAAVEVSSEKWSACPGRFRPWESSVSQAEGDRLARAVPTCAAARWWSDPVQARPQVWIGAISATPTARVMPESAGAKPPTQLWTSSAVAGLPSAWWPVLREGADSGAPDGPQSIWRITPHRDARVFEVRTAGDWKLLCETFPGPIVDGYANPAWDAVTEEFDGIHLSVEGLILAQGARVETNCGPAMLDNWDAESTAWLRWSVVEVERLGTVTSPRSGSSQPVRRNRVRNLGRRK
jgi:hypothetical protein